MNTVQTHTGGIGTGVTVGALVTEWSTAALPLLHVISTCVAIVAGVLTVIWYVKQLRKEDMGATADIAAEVLKAQAVIAAEALSTKKTP